jgi:hypothetical protein
MIKFQGSLQQIGGSFRRNLAEMALQEKVPDRVIGSSCRSLNLMPRKFSVVCQLPSKASSTAGGVSPRKR